MELIRNCCEPVLVEPIAAEEADELAAGFKLLADPVRLRIISLIANSPQGEMCSCDLSPLLGRSQPTISHHLSILVKAGILQREQRGKWAWFTLSDAKLSEVCAALGKSSC